MCQLLGMNCATPTDFNFSFRGFARRGGETDKHEHGWGMAIYEGHGIRTFLDPLPAAESRVAQFVEGYPIKTLNMMAHIRFATQGKVALENVHPFCREMWGIYWSFAHNGEVPKYSNKPYVEYPLLGRVSNRTEVFYHPVGDTDSEAVFCAILNALRAEFTELPTLPVLYETLQRLCAQIVEGDEELTILNFLLGCGQYNLFAYSWPGSRPGSKVWNGLHYTIRKPPFSKAKLADVDYSVDFSTCTTPADRVAVIATAPLTVDEEWKEFKRGQLLMFDRGLAFSESYETHEVETQGRGLFSRYISKCSVPTTSAKLYDTPGLLRELVDEVVSSDTREVVWARKGADLGCGIGCSGVLFRSCCEYLTGVDLSPEMLDGARDRGCYDELVNGNIECVLRKHPKFGRCKNPTHGALAYTTFDLIISLSTFVYIMDIKNVFSDIRELLNCENGIFAFSMEFLDEIENDPEPEKGYVLQRCARYAHKKWYLDESTKASGFATKAFQPTAVPLRQHNGANVYGVLVVLEIDKSVEAGASD
eukprot:CAMPEP_0172489262 /NCGR_PEP_ID=MMETSP1066-20121228/19158_1 /TAXON_ID=671091 /ORGANISM="Coscinodiscus wailesii, Strain CCMP2513" /LENGTH=533 /DNA_ID=CAMNT_0013256985 /DNA_START=394 /DNA_END=1995 /DNA_ORIENTATION=+